MKGFAGLTLLPLMAAASPMLNVGTIHNEAAPILSSSNAKEVPDSYIVVFKKHVTDDGAAAHHSWVQDIHSSSEDSKMELRKRSQFPLTSEIFSGLRHTYNVAGGLLGYSGHFDEDVIEQVRRHPDVSDSYSLPTTQFSQHCSNCCLRFSFGNRIFTFIIICDFLELKVKHVLC